MSEAQRLTVNGSFNYSNGYTNGAISLRSPATRSAIDEFCNALNGKNPIHKKAILLVAMATPEDMRINAEHIRIADQFFESPLGRNRIAVDKREHRFFIKKKRELDKSYQCSDCNGVKRRNWLKESRVGTEQKRTTNPEKFVNHEREETKSRIRQSGRRRWQAENVDVYQNPCDFFTILNRACGYLPISVSGLFTLKNHKQGMWVVGKSGGTKIKPSFDEEFEAEIKMTDTFDRDDNNDFVASRHGTVNYLHKITMLDSNEYVMKICFYHEFKFSSLEINGAYGFFYCWGILDSFNRTIVYGYDSTTKQIYDEGVKTIALSVLNGINSSVFAYRQTSSGKTYTMYGITELAIADIYDYINRHNDRLFVLKFSAIEIYNECVKDLLSVDNTQLRLLDDPEKGTVVEKLTEANLRDCNNLKEFIYMSEGQFLVKGWVVNVEMFRTKVNNYLTKCGDVQDQSQQLLDLAAA
ncbi:hypothetical protein LXL04_003656 [Taraxacum kok-saghyz]